LWRGDGDAGALCGVAVAGRQSKRECSPSYVEPGARGQTVHEGRSGKGGPGGEEQDRVGQR